MKIKKESYPPITMGISFMLVIFITLSMVVFAVLSLSTAKKDLEYSQLNATHTTSYYEASNSAEIELHNLLQNMNQYSDGDIIEFFVEIDDGQSLQVNVELYPSDNNYYIKTWKIISTKDWNGDNTLSVIGSKN